MKASYDERSPSLSAKICSISLTVLPPVVSRLVRLTKCMPKPAETPELAESEVVVSSATRPCWISHDSPPVVHAQMLLAHESSASETGKYSSRKSQPAMGSVAAARVVSGRGVGEWQRGL